MANVITAQLSEPVGQAELSRAWESLRAEMMVPEIVITAEGRDISLRFHAAKADPGFGKLKRIFERALRRYRPDCHIDWAKSPAATA